MSSEHHHPNTVQLYVIHMPQKLSSVLCGSTWCRELQTPSDCESCVRLTYGNVSVALTYRIVIEPHMAQVWSLLPLPAPVLMS